MQPGKIGRCCGWSVLFFQAEDGIRYLTATGVQTCALPICEYLCWRCRDELPVQGSARVATAAPEPEDATDDGFETLDDLGEPPGPARRTWRGRPIPDG